MSSPRGRGPIVLALAVALVVSSCSGGSKHQATSGASTLLPAASGSVTSSSSEESSPAVADSTIAGSAGGARTPTVGSTKKPPAVVGVAGARTAGDVLFPALGNGGYDVTHYDLALDWHQTPPQLVAVATIDAIATESLSAFSLDFTGLDIDAVTVDGSAAEARSVDEKLDVTLAKSIVKGAKFSTIVRYHGDPGLSHGGARIRTGWFTVPDGAYTLDEPDGAHHWFPSNDHPSDKATFTFHVTVDAGQNAVANGRETARTAQAGRVTITSQATEPMAPYLAVVAIGPYSVTSGPGPHRTTLRDVVPANGPVPPGSFLPSIGSQIDFFEQRFGPLPFDSYGVLLAPSQPVLALETQTLSTLSAADYPGPPDVNPGDPANDLADEVRAHELAHQWFGDAVTPSTWRDIWLSEGFATYAQWLWASRDDSSILDERAEAARLHSVSVRAQYGATDDPSATNLFSPSVYDEGAMVLHALRADMGDALFFRLLQDWVDGHRYGTGSTEAFIALASKDAGHDEAALLHLWLSSMDPLPAFPGS